MGARRRHRWPGPLAYLKRYGYQGRIHPVQPEACGDRRRGLQPVDSGPCRTASTWLVLLPRMAWQALEECSSRVATRISNRRLRRSRCRGRAAQLTSDLPAHRHPAGRPTGRPCIRPAWHHHRFSSELEHQCRAHGRWRFTQSDELSNSCRRASMTRLGLPMLHRQRGWTSACWSWWSTRSATTAVELIALTVEGLKQGQRLPDLAWRHARPARRSSCCAFPAAPAGRAAAVSHTGKLAGAWKVWCDVARAGRHPDG